MQASSSKRSAKFEADLAACRAALRGGSHTFFAASLILPHEVRGPASALYAFCRLADDVIDLARDHDAALDDLHRRLARAYAGDPLPHPADRAFAATAAHFAIPYELPAALLEGFAWDAAGRRYDSLEALYLPQDWMREAGLDPDAWLAAPVFDARVGAVVRRLLDAADALYLRGEAGIRFLPSGCRPAIRAAARLYAEIGREVARRGHDSVSGRAVVSTMRKLAVIAGTAIALPTPAPSAPLRAIRYLVGAVDALPVQAEGARVAWWNLQARTVRIIELFERMDARDQARTSGS
jgi:phytoene synthase